MTWECLFKYCSKYWFWHFSVLYYKLVWLIVFIGVVLLWNFSNILIYKKKTYLEFGDTNEHFEFVYYFMVILLYFKRRTLWAKDGNLHGEISWVCLYYEQGRYEHGASVRQWKEVVCTHRTAGLWKWSVPYVLPFSKIRTYQNNVPRGILTQVINSLALELDI
jgi:hypothetical protein